MDNNGEDDINRGEIWLLVDHSSREASLLPVADRLQDQGFSVELVTITEVIGNVARDAIAGGAERLLRGLRVATKGRAGDEDLVGAIRRRQPDVLVVTEARYARAIGLLENLTGVDSLQVGLVPEFFVDPAWFHGQLHAFVVPDDELCDQLTDRGIDGERVRTGGPALRPGFHEKVDRDQARARLGFEDDEQVVLVRADGFDTSTLEKLVFQSTLVDRQLRFVFHHDGDGAVASALRRAADRFGLSAAMFGRVADLESYLSAADAVVAHDADPYLGELLQAQTPSLLVSTRPDAPANAILLARRQLVDHLDDIGQLGTRLDGFTEPDNLEAMRSRLDDWDGVDRHDALVEALDDIARHSEQWRYPAQGEEPRDEEPDKESRPEQQRGGPFETIGERESEKTAPTGDGRTRPRAAGERSDFSGLSRAEAKDQLAELILKERETERRLKDLEKQQQRWRNRLQLAREWNEEDLVEEAKSILRGYIDEAEPVERNLEDIRRQKEKLKQAAGGAGEGTERADEDFDARVSRLEERFRQMEVDSDLEGLKDRIRRELGE